MSDKLTGNYNKIVCSECGAAASIIFDYISNSEYSNPFKDFTAKDLQERLVFLNKKEFDFAIKKLIKCKYIDPFKETEWLNVSSKTLTIIQNIKKIP